MTCSPASILPLLLLFVLHPVQGGQAYHVPDDGSGRASMVLASRGSPANFRAAARSMRSTHQGSGGQMPRTQPGICRGICAASDRTTTARHLAHLATMAHLATSGTTARQQPQHALKTRLRGGGIAGFGKWFQGQFPESVIKVHDGSSSTFDHVCFDMNGILHSACRRAHSVEHAVLRVYREIDFTLRTLTPGKSVVLAFDGPGPNAKLITQRRRRNKKALTDKYKISGLNITPGTQFMREVREAVEYYSCSRLQTSYKLRNVSFYVSGSDVAGEGEVKIIEWVHHVLGGMAGIKKDESIVVVGGDADLVLQGIATAHQDFFIYSGKDGHRKSDICFSMWKVAKKLDETFPGQSDTVRTDLLVLLILNGNDYLPKMRGISFGLLYKAYKKVKADPVLGKQSLIRGGSERTFNWQFFHALMRHVQRDRFVLPLNEAEIAKSTAASASAMVVKDYVSMLTSKAQKGRMTLEWETIAGPGGGFIVSVAAVGETEKIAGASGEEERTIKLARQSACFDALVSAGDLERGGGWWEESGRIGTKDEGGGAVEEEGDGKHEEGDASVSRLGLGEGGVWPGDGGGEGVGDDDERSMSLLRSGSVSGTSEEEEEEEDGDDDEDDGGDSMLDEEEMEMEDGEEDLDVEGETAAEPGKPIGSKSRRGKRLYGEKEYAQGILWNIQMYIDGFCPDYQYVYPCKYAPDARAIANWIESQDYEPQLGSPTVPMSNKGALTPLEACVAMMPPGGGDLLPESVRNLINDSGSPLFDMCTSGEEEFNIEKMSAALKDSEQNLVMTESEASNVRKGSGWKVFKRFDAGSDLPRDFVSSVRTPLELAMSESPSTISANFLTEADMPKPPLSDNGKFRPVPEGPGRIALFEVEGILESPMQRWPEGELDTQERGGSGRFDEARWTPFQDPPAAGGGRKGGRGRGGKTRSGRGEGGKWEVIKAGYRAQHRGNVNLGRGGGGGFQARMPARGGVQSLVAPQREVFIQSRMHQHPLTGSMRQSHSGKPVHAPASHGDSSRVHPSRLPLPGMQHAPNCPLHHHHHAGQ